MRGDASIPLARVMAMAFRVMITALHERLAQRGFQDIRPAFGFALLHVRDHQATVQDIAALMGMSKQAASKLIAVMEAARLLRRAPDPDDGRAYRLTLAARGRRLLEVVEETYEEIEAEWAEVIGADALEDVRGRLAEVVRATSGGALPAVRPVW